GGAATGSTEIVQKLQRRKVPFVLVDRLVSGVTADSVRGDSRGGACEVTTHLLRTGYRRIGLITGPHTVSTAEDRVEGYLEALNDMGISAGPDLICYGPYRESWGYQ